MANHHKSFCFFLYALVCIFITNVETAPAVIDPIHDELNLVGLFLGAHKYFDVDRRRGNVLSWKYDMRVYNRHFPIPRLKRLHPRVSSACDQGALECIREISSTATDSYSLSDIPSTSDKPLPPGTPDYYPLWSALELFQYRATATYYMCWFTMQRNELLMNHLGKDNCLKDLNKVKEKSWSDIDIKDFRKGSPRTPWICAEILFCPDPCYGRKEGGNVPSKIALRDDPGNPCRHLKDRTCKWIPEDNTDFDSLQRNRFNISCECHKNKAGFRWSSRFKLCVDVDECTEKKVKCDVNKICQNTVGSFECVCRMGSKFNSEKDLCVDHVPLPAHGYHRTAKVKAVKQKTALTKFLEYLFGLNKPSKT